MTQNRVINTSVGYTVNQSSVAAVQAANSQVAASFASAQATIVNVGANMTQLSAMTQANAAAAGVAINANVVVPMQAASAATQALIRDIGDLGRDIESIPEPPMSAFGLSEDDPSGGGSGGSGLGGLRSGLRAGGFLLGSQDGGQDLRAASQIITLTSVMGPLGAVAGVAALALREVTASQEAAAKAAQAYNDALKGSGGQTTADVQKNISDLNLQKLALEDGRKTLTSYQSSVGDISTAYSRGLISVDEYNTNLKNLNAEIYDATGGALGLKDGVGQAVSNIGDFNGALGNNKDALTEVNGKIVLNTALLGSQALALNDLAIAEKRISDSQLELAHASADAQTMTAAARQKEADSISAHITALEESIDDYHITGAALGALHAEINSLENRLAAITDTTHSWADTLDDIAKRSTAVDNLFAATTAAGEALQKVAADQQAIAAGAVEHADNLRQIQTDEQTKELEDRQKAAQSALDDQQKYLQRVAEIDAQAHADHEADVGNRDALANYKDAQKADQSVAKETATYALQEQQLQTHLDQTLQAQQAAAAKSVQNENAHYAVSSAAEIRHLNDDQVAQSRAAGLELAYQRQADDAQLTARIQANNAVVAVDQSANVAQETAAIVHQNALYNIAYAGGAALEQVFAATMAHLAQIAASVTPDPAQGGVGAGTVFFPPATSGIQAIVDARMAQAVREAMR